MHAANPHGSNAPPMRVLGQVAVPLRFENDDRVREVTMRVTEGLPYSMIIGSQYFRRHQSALDFRPFKGFQPAPDAPWIPFANQLNHQPYGSLLRLSLRRACRHMMKSHGKTALVESGMCGSRKPSRPYGDSPT